MPYKLDLDPNSVDQEQLNSTTGFLGKTNFAPKQRKVVLRGKIEKGVNSDFAINGTEFFISESTWIFGQIEYGSLAIVKGKLNGEGHCFANFIKVRSAVPQGSQLKDELCWDV